MGAIFVTFKGLKLSGKLHFKLAEELKLKKGA